MTWFKRRARFASLLAASALALALTAITPSLRAQNDDGLILSFSTVGDSRQDPVTFDPTTAANYQLRSAAEIEFSVFRRRHDHGLRLGKSADGCDRGRDCRFGPDEVYRQYGFWRGMVGGLMQNGTYVVPVAGNHESQCKSCGKTAKVENENAWRANMGDLIVDTARFTSLFGQQPTNVNAADNSALDGLTTDQSQLSYSFDFRGSHFAVINTDPVGNDAHAPAAWLETDLSAAVGRGVKHLFVFGHKPAFTYYYGAVTSLPAAPSGLDNDLASRDLFWDVIEKYGATYFCGHEHIFHLSQPRLGNPTKPGKAWQVLVGSGGSPFEAATTDITIAPTDRTYAWATVNVYDSGKVKLYRFDDHFGATKVIDKVVLNP